MYMTVVVQIEKTRSSESDGRSDVTDSLDCPNKFRLP